MAVLFGELARLRCALSEGDLSQALDEQKRRRARGERRRVGELLTGRGRLSAEQVRRLLTEQGKALLACPCGWRVTVSGWGPGLHCRCEKCRRPLSPAEGEDLSSAADAPAVNLSISMGETVRIGPAPAEPPPPPEAPAVGRGGRYTRVVEIAEGGMGKVFLVHDRELGRNVVMKVLHEDRKDAESVRRFLSEAHITARLEHPNIVPVYDQSVDEEGRPYFTMKMVRGVDLGEIIAARRKGEVEYSLIRILQVLQSICDAVGYAHEQGILHRDLKPENIMHGDYGEVFVMDWGLAREVSKPDAASPAHPERRGANRTQDGVILGTPAYMSPEQARGEPLTTRSDIYSLGAILYEIFTREPPYTGKTPQEILDRIIAGPPRSPREVDPGIPAPLEAICLKAMARGSGERYATASEMSEEIQRFIEGRSVLAERLTWWGLMLRRVHRHTRAAIVAGAMLLLLGGLLALERVQRKGLKDQVRGLERIEEARLAREAAEKVREQEVRAVVDEAASVASLPAALEILQEASHSADAQTLKGRLLAFSGRHREAEAAFTEALKLRPSDAAALRGRAASRRALGDLKGGEADLAAAPPTRAGTLGKAGEEALKKGDPKAALEAFEGALALAPSDPRFRRGRSDALLRLNRPAEAVEDLALLVGSDSSLRLTLAAARAKGGDVEAAMADYALAALDPKRAAPAHQGVLEILSTAEPAEAVKAWLAWSAKRKVRDEEAYERLLKRKAFDAALTLASRRIADKPEDAALLGTRIQIRRMMRASGAALPDCEKLVELTKGAPESRYLKAAVLLEAGKPFDAMGALSECEAALGGGGGDSERRAIQSLKDAIQKALAAGR